MRIALLLLLASRLIAVEGEAVRYHPLTLPFGVDPFDLTSLQGASEDEVRARLGWPDEGQTLAQRRVELEAELAAEGRRLRAGVGVGTIWRYGPLVTGPGADQVPGDLNTLLVYFSNGRVSSVAGQLARDPSPLLGADEMVNTLFPRIVDLRWYPPTLASPLGTVTGFEVKVIQVDWPANVTLVQTPLPHLTYVFGGKGAYRWSVRCRHTDGVGEWVEMGTVTNTR